jgi:hypothetical protein
MHTFFCPRCGGGYESGEATQRTRAKVVCSVYCPSCDEKLQVTGNTLLLLWFFFTFLFGDLAVLYSPILGLTLFYSTAAIGVLRIVRQVRARARTRRAERKTA